MTGKRKLPEGWRWVSLGDESLVRLIMGQSPPGETYNKDQIGLPFFQGCADFGSLYPKPTVWCSAPQRIAEPNDILVSVRAPVGPTNITKERCCIGRGLAAIRCKEGLSYRYLLLALRHFERKLSSGGAGSIFNAIGKDEIKVIEFPVPPTYDDQVAIVNELERKMANVEKTQQAALRQKEAAEAIQDAIFREVFPYKVGKKLPEGWGWRKLGDIARLKNGINFDSSQVGKGVLTLDVFNMFSNNINPLLTDLYRVDTILSDEYILQKDDILFVRSSVKKEGVGWPTVFQGCNETVTFCGFLIRARLIQTNIFAPYTVYYFRKQSVRDNFISASGQSTITNINQENLNKVLIPIPTTIDKQVAIVKQIEAKLSHIENMRQASNRQLEAVEAFSGAILREVFDFDEDIT